MCRFVVVPVDEEVRGHRIGQQQVRLDGEIFVVFKLQIEKNLVDSPGEAFKTMILQHAEKNFVPRVSHHADSVGLKNRRIRPVCALADADTDFLKIAKASDAFEPGQ